MAAIDVRDRWRVVNRDTGATVQTNYSKPGATAAALVCNAAAEQYGAKPVYTIALNPEYEGFRDLLQVAFARGVDLAPLFATD